jgi:hypothetical protein
VWPDIPAGYFKSGPDNPATLEIGQGPEDGGVRITQKARQIFRPDYSRSARIIRPAGLSGPNLPQIIRPWRLQLIHFGEGYLYPSPSSSPACSSSSRIRHYLEPTSLLDLHLQPPKVPDLWRIEGGGPDLHHHQRNFFSLSICLGNSFLVVPWKH